MSGFFPSYVLEVIANNLDVVALYNDWPAHRSDHPRNSITTSMRLNAMTFEEPNVLSVIAKPLPDIQKGEPLPENALIQVSLFQMLAPDEMVYLFAHCWRAAHRPLVVDAYTEVARHQISFTKTFGRWGFQDARPYMPEDRPAVLEALHRVHGTLLSKNFEAYGDLCAIKLEEVARATGRSAAVIRDESVKLVGFMGDAAGWDMEPIVDEDIVIESYCHGRLVQCFRGKQREEPLLGYVGGSGPMAFPVMFSRVGERWLPVR
jgi:hypothetical protein